MRSRLKQFLRRAFGIDFDLQISVFPDAVKGSGPLFRY